jgi:hypothetical protein
MLKSEFGPLLTPEKNLGGHKQIVNTICFDKFYFVIAVIASPLKYPPSWTSPPGGEQAIGQAF